MGGLYGSAPLVPWFEVLRVAALHTDSFPTASPCCRAVRLIPAVSRQGLSKIKALLTLKLGLMQGFWLT